MTKISTKTAWICCVSLMSFSAGAFAQDKAAAPPGALDMSKVGPMSRPVTNEKEAKKGIEALYKTMHEGWMKGDVMALADNVDFPVIMLSDDSSGLEHHYESTRDQWIAMMKPMAENMPKDAKVKMKQTPHFLSDTLAVVVEETSMTMGKMKGKWKGFSVVTFKDGKWKVKQMSEAGWGDVKPPGAPTAKK